MSLPGGKSKEGAQGMPLGGQTLLAQVRLNRDTALKTARAMMVLMQIKRVGQIVACQPVEADIRSGGFEDQFMVTFTTSSKPEAVQTALAAIPDVVDVRISAV
jgi:two-component system chemotaxis sensor kinase CheA